MHRLDDPSLMTPDERCAMCELRLCDVPSSHDKEWYQAIPLLRLQPGSTKGWDHSATKSIPAAQIEQFVVDEIRAIGRDPGLVAATVKQSDTAKQSGPNNQTC